MKIIITVLIFSLCVFSGRTNKIFSSKDTKIRVINHTEFDFTNVMLFSLKFEDLKPNDTSAYQILNFNELRDDPLIYCSVGDRNFARYLKIPKDGLKNVSYVIDSIDNGIMHLSTDFD